jgi:hypothetical protein
MVEEKAGSSDEDDQPFITDFLGMESKPEPVSPTPPSPLHMIDQIKQPLSARKPTEDDGENLLQPLQ